MRELAVFAVLEQGDHRDLGRMAGRKAFKPGIIFQVRAADVPFR